MQKVSYMGNGSTTEFYFNFSYFENSNVVVTKNNQPATGYNIIGNSGDLNADIPYTGGKVVFETAPSSIDSITIARSLPLSRIADYQPPVQIQPTILNQDLNYMMEVLKDLQDELDVLHAQYSDITDKESTDILLAKITAISDAITTVSQQIIDLGDISTIHDSISTLNTRTMGLQDYVIESQIPSEENNYTWYRKYKSGWVEQGGHTTSSDAGTICSFPVEMRDTNYSALVSVTGDSSSNFSTAVKTKQTNYITVSTYTETRPCDWMIFGFSAA